jgi:Na+/melibiose symporter-like transporter
MTAAADGHARVPLKTKLAFGIGASAETIALYGLATWAMVFYNQVRGVPAWMVGLALSIGLILDGLIEPMVGSWSDRTRSRWGRRHPWMFGAAIPFALSFYGFWNPPLELTTIELVIWAAIMVSIMRQSMACFHTPHLALGGEMSPNYLERTRVMSYNSFFSWAGGASMVLFGLSLFFPRTPEFRNGLLNPEGWPRFSLTFAVAVFAIIIISSWFTRDRIPFLTKPAHDTPKFSAVEFVKDIGRALGNINYVWLLFGYFFLALMLGLRENLRTYLYLYYWQLTTEQMRWLVLGSFVGYAAAFFFAAHLHGRFDKKRTIITAISCYAIVPAIPILMGMAGIIGPQTPGLLAILIAFYSVQAGSLSVLAISVMSALADIADENELKHGVRQEGILYSTRALSAKLDQAAGSFAAGLVVSYIGLSAKAKPGQVSDDVLYNLALWDGPVAAVPGVIAIFFYGRYRITKAANDATKLALAERRAARTALAAGAAQ